MSGEMVVPRMSQQQFNTIAKNIRDEIVHSPDKTILDKGSDIESQHSQMLKLMKSVEKVRKKRDLQHVMVKQSDVSMMNGGVKQSFNNSVFSIVMGSVH
eukprot:CAMPEP_0170560102 /NCGR_PEP_ID=MMETSP0211-20121228/47046_1 /TAXON_ID=311385 /ORGANISM="Pseudokeronopsis sp., Strain OXSARD2" /LENGTH=98 /DNA_ID=CAMNT_0010873917 /DNA_START=115 /DNA_END=408 /DNA_ORIENTATION=-